MDQYQQILAEYMDKMQYNHMMYVHILLPFFAKIKFYSGALKFHNYWSLSLVDAHLNTQPKNVFLVLME